MTYEQWRTFYNRREGDVYDGWGKQLMPHFVQLKIYCAVIFRYHHTRLTESCKKNSNLFGGTGRCKIDGCPEIVIVEVEDEPKKKVTHVYSK